MKAGIQTKAGGIIDEDELSQRLKARTKVVREVARRVGPASIRDLARACGVNRQTIVNALNAATDDGEYYRVKGSACVRSHMRRMGRPPAARERLADMIDEVLPALTEEGVVSLLRAIASDIESGAA